jgi:hypothetical protein
VASLDTWIAWLVYASVALGAVFLAVARGIVPDFLFYAILGGEVAYVVCAVLVALRVRGARYFALALAVVTLASSLPQPQHYEFAETGQLVAFLIFAGGSALRFFLIVAFLLRTFRSRGPAKV